MNVERIVSMIQPEALRRIVPELEAVIAPAQVLRDDHDDFAKYGSDETEDLVFLPDIVVRPETTEQVSKILKLCYREKVPITPRGGGTGLSGGALPVHGGVVLSLERMNKILEIDKENFFARVQPGVITQTFQETVEAEGLFYPPDPASRGTCTIGGNLAEGAGGPRALKYGVTKDYVYGVEAVLPQGEIIRLGGKLLKDVVGYNLLGLLIGSEGTLAVITEATLKLIPLPRYRKTLLVPFSDMTAAARTVPAIMRRGIIPCAIEFMERACIKAIEAHREMKIRYSDAAAQLLVEVDGNDETQLEHELEIIAEECEKENALEVFVAETTAKQNEIWEMRRSAGEAVKSISAYKEEDTVVPRARLPELVEGIHEIANRWGISIISYGHAGDGNIHCNILKRDLDDNYWNETLPKAIEEIFRLTIHLGGTISGEHGIGYSQKRYLPIALGAAEIALMQALKKTFDPLGLLNPGKIFPDS
ncbi:MAG: FAD-linked oxidase C-terminal domain-containing protein [bacterium]